MKVLKRVANLVVVCCLIGNPQIITAAESITKDSSQNEWVVNEVTEETSETNQMGTNSEVEETSSSENSILESKNSEIHPKTEAELEQNAVGGIATSTVDSDISEATQKRIREDALAFSEQILKQRKVPAHVSTFINSLLLSVNNISKTYNLYSSVMLAQASLESGWGQSTLASAPNYNLFGVKWSGQGSYVEMITNEEVNGEMIEVLAKFQKYNNYEESLIDYAKKIRNGPSWDVNYYSGVWKESASTYKEATLALTGRYATDSQYHVKLNSIISSWGYDLYDKEFATYELTGTNLNKKVAVANTDYFFYTEPYRTIGSIRDEK